MPDQADRTENWEPNSLNGSLLRLRVSGYFVINDRPIGGLPKTPGPLERKKAKGGVARKKEAEEKLKWAEEWALCNAPAVSYVSRLHRLPSTHRQCATSPPPPLSFSLIPLVVPGLGAGGVTHTWVCRISTHGLSPIVIDLITASSQASDYRLLSLSLTLPFPSPSSSPPLWCVFSRTVITPCRAVLLLPLASVVYCSSSSTLSICNFRFCMLADKLLNHLHVRPGKTAKCKFSTN